jgi:hypothetical protein
MAGQARAKHVLAMLGNMSCALHYLMFRLGDAPNSENYRDFVEMFAGVQTWTKAMRAFGFVGEALDASCWAKLELEATCTD